MKSTAYIINTSRGAILDEAALFSALNEDRIAGAALDVFKIEPAIDNPLVANDKVIVSPHIAASTDDAQQSAITIVEQILDILVEQEHENPLNLAVVSLDKIFPHELIDPRRVESLIKKLNASEVFTNPPIVVQSKDYYVVLDGATRTAALKQLGYPHIIVQVLKDKSHYTLDQVLQTADAGHVMPAGITRFIIPGRVMRLNADFEYLKSDIDINEKNRWLYDLVMEKLSNGEARYYAEPIYLMDE